MNSTKSINRRAIIVQLLAFPFILPACGGDTTVDIVIPLPTTLRNDLKYGYYISLPGQTAKVKDHTNLIWHGQFYDNTLLQQELQGNELDVVLNCGVQLFDDNTKTVSSTAREALHNYFTDLNNRGILHRIKYLTPFDEPNFFVKQEQELRDSMVILREEVNKWPVLVGVKYLCIYGSNNNFMALDEFDIVGVDNYAEGSGVLTTGSHAKLMKLISPLQKVMVIPGAAYGQNPEAFIAYAHSNAQVWGVIPFLWSHVPASADKEGWIGLENQSEAAKDIYRKAGLLTLNKT